MSNITIPNPTQGIVSVGRIESGRPSLPNKTDAPLVGAKLRNHLQTIYPRRSILDDAVDLTAPHFEEEEILKPINFEAAALNLADKMHAELMTRSDPEAADPAVSQYLALNDTRTQCRINSLSLKAER